jgi:hypothetical protein
VNVKKIEFINHQLLKIKFTFRRSFNWPKRRYQLVRGPRDGADQGGAVVPDNGVATHEIRPETHD